MNSSLTSTAAFDVSQLQALIFDLDGVIWRGHTPIAGAVESVLRLRQSGRRCFFATNNSRLLQSEFAARLNEIGLEAQAEDVLTSALATAWHLGSRARGFSVYVVGENGIKTELANIGARVIDESEAENLGEVDVVVVGIDRFFNYDKLRLAQKFLLRGAEFIATNSDWTFPTENGVVPGAGSIVASVQAASQMEPKIIGKPEPAMLTGCIKQFGLNSETTAMVGDRLDTDIACAHRAGIRAIHVETGVHTREQAMAATGLEFPDALFADLPALCAAVVAGVEGQAARD